MPTVTFTTSIGSFKVRLMPEHAPATVNNFVELATGKRPWRDPRTGQESTEPLYDGTVFHRVIPDFMIQGGDPEGTGRGGPGYQFEDDHGSGRPTQGGRRPSAGEPGGLRPPDHASADSLPRERCQFRVHSMSASSRRRSCSRISCSASSLLRSSRARSAATSANSSSA